MVKAVRGRSERDNANPPCRVNGQRTTRYLWEGWKMLSMWSKRLEEGQNGNVHSPALVQHGRPPDHQVPAVTEEGWAMGRTGMERPTYGIQDGGRYIMEFRTYEIHDVWNTGHLEYRAYGIEDGGRMSILAELYAVSVFASEKTRCFFNYTFFPTQNTGFLGNLDTAGHK